MCAPRTYFLLQLKKIVLLFFFGVMFFNGLKAQCPEGGVYFVKIQDKELNKSVIEKEVKF